MNTSKNNMVVSNEHIYLSHSSIAASLFEKELIDKGIQYSTSYVTIRQAYIVFSFFKKDVSTVKKILDTITNKLQQQKDADIKKQKLIKQQKRKTIEYKQYRIGVWLIIFIVTIIILAFFIQ